MNARKKDILKMESDPDLGILYLKQRVTGNAIHRQRS